MKNNILAIITARAGSKGLKNKNLKRIDNKPLVFFPINAASKSKNISKVIVSTDSFTIAKTAKRYGAEVPFIRPKNIAKDNTSSFRVIKHALDYFKKKKIEFSKFILLEPTSPFTTTKDIDNALALLKKSTIAKSVVGISKTESTHPIFSCLISKKGLIKPFKGGKFSTVRRQEISDLYFFDGSLYISEVKTYLDKKTFYHNKTLPYVTPKWKSFEVDDILDLTIMKAIYKFKKHKKSL